MDIEWRLGIGDPTIWGWLTVVAYAIAAVSALRAANVAHISGRNWKAEGAFWFGVTLLMVALGINKQLDLQSFLTEVARDWAKASGWYAGRRQVQEAAIVLLFISAVCAAVGSWVLMRRAATEIKLAVASLSLVIAFVVIRAASFHHIDALIGSQIGGVSWNALLELPGILLTALGAILYRARVRRRSGRFTSR